MPPHSLPKFSRRGRALCAVAIGLVALLCGGCMAIYLPRTVTATVRDAETGAPIEGATVRCIYLRSEIELNYPRALAPRGITRCVSCAQISPSYHLRRIGAGCSRWLLLSGPTAPPYSPAR